MAIRVHGLALGEHADERSEAHAHPAQSLRRASSPEHMPEHKHSLHNKTQIKPTRDGPDGGGRSASSVSQLELARAKGKACVV